MKADFENSNRELNFSYEYTVHVLNGENHHPSVILPYNKTSLNTSFTLVHIL